MLGFPETLQQPGTRVLAEVPVPRAQDTADEGVKGRRLGSAEALGKTGQWGRDLVQSAAGTPCVLSRYMQKRVIQICRYLCGYGMCIYICTHTYSNALAFSLEKAMRQEKEPDLAPERSKTNPQAPISRHIPVYLLHLVLHRHLGCWSRRCMFIQLQSSGPS